MSAQHQLLVLPSASIVVLGLQKEMRQHEATLENEHLLGDPHPKTIALAGWEVVFFLSEIQRPTRFVAAVLEDAMQRWWSG